MIQIALSTGNVLQYTPIGDIVAFEAYHGTVVKSFITAMPHAYHLLSQANRAFDPNFQQPISSAKPEHPLPMPTENRNGSPAIPTSIEMDENGRKPMVERDDLEHPLPPLPT